MQNDWDARDRFSDAFYYTHANLYDNYDPSQDNHAYYWNDDYLRPTGIFPSNGGQRIDHYQPFGMLDFRPGGNGGYQSAPSHYVIDDQNRHQDFNYPGFGDDWMRSRDVPFGDNMRWSHRQNQGRYGLSDNNPFDTDQRGGWLAPTGGDYGYFDSRYDPTLERRGGPYMRRMGDTRDLRPGYYLDRDDYMEGRYFPRSGNGGDQPGMYAEEIRGDRDLRGAWYDEWPEF